MPNDFSLFEGIDRQRFTVAMTLKSTKSSQPMSGLVVAMNQTHSSNIAYVDYQNGAVVADRVQFDDLRKHQLSTTPDDQHSNALPGCDTWVVDSDALITEHAGLILSVKTADCLPIFIMGGGLIAVIHAGRVGTLDLITNKVSSKLLLIVEAELSPTWLKSMFFKSVAMLQIA